MTRWYWLNPDKTIRPRSDVNDIEAFKAYADWFYGYDDDGVPNKLVARDELYGKVVSTVFLGLDHGFSDEAPVLFETIVFDNNGAASESDRYRTWEEAIAGHQKYCDDIRAENPYVMADPEFSLGEIEEGKSLLKG